MRPAFAILAMMVALLGACAAHDARGSRGAATRTASVAPIAPSSLFGDTLDGQRVELSAPGPVRLVELWATWCAPCGPATAVARPVLTRHPRVVAYSLALDDREAVTRHVAVSPALGSVLVYPGGAAAATRRGLNQLPMFVAIDPHGRVAGTIVGLRPGLAAALDRLLGQAEGRNGRVD